jgi:large subunit ribosomal protein L25
MSDVTGRRPEEKLEKINARSSVMEQKTLSGYARKPMNKRLARAIRREGKIPSIIYGHRDPVSVSVNETEFSSKFKVISENVIIQLSVDDTTYDVLVKDFQEDIITGKIIHIDFFEIEKGKLLKTHVPFLPKGTPVGQREGGLFEILVHEVEVECLPKDIPEMISIDVSELKLGHSIHVKELPVFEGVKMLNSPDQVVCVVTRKKEAKIEEEKPEEAAAEEGKKEEEAGGAETKE